MFRGDRRRKSGADFYTDMARVNERNEKQSDVGGESREAVSGLYIVYMNREKTG